MLSSFPHRERDISIAHWNQPLLATTVKTSLVFAGLKVGVRVPIFKKSRKGLLFLTMATITSRWERRLAIHKNVNATLVPLRTSVCGLRSQQVVGATLNMWQVLLLSHVFSNGILNQMQIFCKNTHLLTDLLKSVHTHKCVHKHNSLGLNVHRPSPQWTCHVSGRQGSDTVCFVRGLYRLGKRTKDLTEAVWGPTITAWNITAAKEVLLWQEENWAPVSDSADQGNLCRHKES